MDWNSGLDVFPGICGSLVGVSFCFFSGCYLCFVVPMEDTTFFAVGSKSSGIKW